MNNNNALAVVFVGLVAILIIFFGTTWSTLSQDTAKIIQTCKEIR